eukprot:gene19614-20063_t
MTGGKAPLWIAAALAASACVVGTLGVVVIRDWQASIATAATEGCHLADLQAAETARDATQGRYDALSRDMATTADRLRAEAAARVAQVQAVLDAERAKPRSVKTCTIMRALLPAMALTLAACAGAPPVAAPIAPARLPWLDSTIREPCAAPVDLPDSIASDRIPPLWARDRAALLDCLGRHGAAVGAYGTIQGDK